MRTWLFTGIAAAALLAGCERDSGTTSDGRSGTPPGSTGAPPPPAPDNTGINARDAAGTTPTPLDQGNSPRDIEISAAIRRAITGDASMSVNARNVKIVTADGVVTLRGVVDSQAEKDAIEAMARAVDGVARVDNQLEVRAP